jgi:hypothetical protein
MHKLQSASEKRPVAPTGITRLLLTTALRMAIMGPSGSEAAVSSSALGLGTTGRIISTATSIINSTIARATTGGFPARGAAPAEHRAEFHGQAMHDVHGHEAPRGHNK